MFLHLSVIMFTGGGGGEKGVSLTSHRDLPTEPPWNESSLDRDSPRSETPVDRESSRETLLDSDSLDRDPRPSVG